MDLSVFPSLDAALNATTAVLLSAGFAAIRARRVALHRALMLAAFATSLLFLACYLWYHAHVGSKHFPGTGTLRVAYLAILLSHTVLAALVVPLALVTLARGLRGRHPQHERLARWTLPLWLYVSLTGVVVYAMLYG
jgi:putative membrane protein